MKLKTKLIIATIILVIAPIFKINSYDGSKIITTRESALSIVIMDIVNGTIGTKF